MKLVIIICLFPLLASPVYSQHKKQFNKTLADSLATLEKVDQVAAQRHSADLRFVNFTLLQWNNFQDSVFSNHEVILDRMFKIYGYPGYDLVGKVGANNYWRMVQHCDKHPEFQLKILKAMEKEVENDNADGKDYAYLVDRVNLNTGKKQVFGTQVKYDTDSCQAYPKPLADSLSVNKRRAKLGLESIEEYLNGLSDIHFLMNSSTYEKKGIHHAILYPIASQ